MIPNSSRTIRAAIYARVSTLHHGQDVGMQVEELRAVARQRGWEIIQEYIDEGFSGSRTDRPALDRMMADARLGKIDLVAVWKLDRLGRSLIHLISLLDTLNHVGVQFVSLHDPIDTTSPQGRLLTQILGSFAEYERALIQERVRAGVLKAQASGKHCGRPMQQLDLRPALSLLKEGHGLKAVSKMLGVDRATLRRRLLEAGKWTADKGVQ